MVAIEVAVPTAHRSTGRPTVRDAADWGRVVVATLARGVVATLLGMALWAAAPALIGWHPTTVMTGSMEPRLTPGDVVVSRPVTPAELRQGQILLFDDPDHAGELRMHRYVEAGPDGTLVTKGDANPQDDSTPVARSAVHGVAFLRIPYVATPIVWMRDGEWHRVVLLALGLAVLLFLGTVDGSLRRLADPAAVPADGDDDGLEARLAAAMPAPSGDGRDDDPAAGTAPTAPDATAHGGAVRDGILVGLQAGVAGAVADADGVDATTRRDVRRRARRARRARRVRRVRRVGGALAVLLVAGGAGLLLPAKASAAPFGASTKASVSLSAAAVVAPSSVTCTNNTDKTSVTLGWAYTGSETPASFDVLNGTAVYANVGPTVRSQVLQAGTSSASGTRTISVRTNTSYGWSATSGTVAVVVTNNGSGTVTARCG